MTEFLKYLGFLFMLVDHLGYLYFPHVVWLRLVGRWSAPIFFYLLAVGYRRSKNLKRYAYRLVGWGLFAQVVVFLLGVFPEAKLNIILTLAWCLFTLISIHRAPSKFKLAIALGSAVIASLIPLEYGWYGVLSCLLFTLYSPAAKWWWGLWVLINGLAILDPTLTWLQFFALPVPFLISAFENQKQDLPRLGWFWYVFYPLQWVILCAFGDVGGASQL